MCSSAMAWVCVPACAPPSNVLHFCQNGKRRVVRHPPHPLSTLQSCPGCSGRRDCIGLVPNVVQPHKTSVLSAFPHLTPNMWTSGELGHYGYPVLHQVTTESSRFDPGCPVIAIVWPLMCASVLSNLQWDCSVAWTRGGRVLLCVT